ncbi:hypothetical protein ACHAP7_007168 [Fusarium lateritium]
MLTKRAFNDSDVDALLDRLTLEEKIALLSGQGSFETTGLPVHGIPSIMMDPMVFVVHGSLLE